MPRLIWVFAGRTVTLFVLSCRRSFVFCTQKTLHWLPETVTGCNLIKFYNVNSYLYFICRHFARAISWVCQYSKQVSMSVQCIKYTACIPKYSELSEENLIMRSCTCISKWIRLKECTEAKRQGISSHSRRQDSAPFCFKCPIRIFRGRQMCPLNTNISDIFCWNKCPSISLGMSLTQ